ncbi:MAG: arsenate reductase ArsC [Calditrichota bacterium]
MPKPRVLVVCTGNSMRSQLAEGVLRDELGEQIEVYSAGTHPSSVYPMVIQVLEEAGIDTSKHRSKSVTEFLEMEIDLVITVCDNAEAMCPYMPNAKKRIHKGYPDPLHRDGTIDTKNAFRELRDRLRWELTPLVVKELGLSVN